MKQDLEQFYTGDIWKQVNQLLNKRQNKTACIAYVTSDNLKLSKGDLLICDASAFAIKFGETSARALAYYYNHGVKIYSNQQLHCKFILTEHFVVIGSANLSKSSAEKLIEASIITDNPILISQTKSFCHNLLRECNILTEEKINSLLKIKVVKRPHKPTTRSKTRQEKFGDKYWFVAASPLPERTMKKIQSMVDATTNFLAEQESVNVENIDFLRWDTSSEFTKTAKKGDQIILKFNSRTRTYVYPSSTILRKEIKNGFTYIYHACNHYEESGISWTDFQRAIKQIPLEKNFTSNRTKLLSKSDADKLQNVWQ